MNKDQFARLQRHRKVQQTLSEHAAAVAAVPAFARLATRYQEQLARLDGAARKNAVTSEGATQAKGAMNSALTARLVKAANALYLLHRAEGNQQETAKLHRRPSDYTNMPDLQRATEATLLSQALTARQVDLKDYNVTAADVAALAADAASFQTLLTAPQLAIDAAKIQGATARLTLSSLNAFLKDDLRSGMELLRDTHPAAYSALREASQVDEAGSRKGKVGQKGRAAFIDRSITNSKSFFLDPELMTAESSTATSAITLTGPAGAAVEVRVAAKSKGSCFITHAPEGGAAVGITPVKGQFSDIGATVPERRTFTFSFIERPWQASIEILVAGQTQMLRMSSTSLNLPDGELGKRDKWEVTVAVSSN